MKKISFLFLLFFMNCILLWGQNNVKEEYTLYKRRPAELPNLHSMELGDSSSKLAAYLPNATLYSLGEDYDKIGIKTYRAVENFYIISFHFYQDKLFNIEVFYKELFGAHLYYGGPIGMFQKLSENYGLFDIILDFNYYFVAHKLLGKKEIIFTVEPEVKTYLYKNIVHFIIKTEYRDIQIQSYINSCLSQNN